MLRSVLRCEQLESREVPAALYFNPPVAPGDFARWDIGANWRVGANNGPVHGDVPRPGDDAYITAGKSAVLNTPGTYEVSSLHVQNGWLHLRAALISGSAEITGDGRVNLWSDRINLWGYGQSNDPGYFLSYNLHTESGFLGKPTGLPADNSGYVVIPPNGYAAIDGLFGEANWVVDGDVSIEATGWFSLGEYSGVEVRDGGNVYLRTNANPAGENGVLAHDDNPNSITVRSGGTFRREGPLERAIVNLPIVLDGGTLDVEGDLRVEPGDVINYSVSSINEGSHIYLKTGATLEVVHGLGLNGGTLAVYHDDLSPDSKAYIIGNAHFNDAILDMRSELYRIEDGNIGLSITGRVDFSNSSLVFSRYDSGYSYMTVTGNVDFYPGNNLGLVTDTTSPPPDGQVITPIITTDGVILGRINLYLTGWGIGSVWGSWAPGELFDRIQLVNVWWQ